MKDLVLLRIFDSVAKRFEEERTDVSLVFGWREPQQQGNQNDATRAYRVCFIPGNAADSVGTVGPAMYPGQNPSCLGILTEQFRVRMWAIDNTDHNNERLQYQAAMVLFHVVFRALTLCDVPNLLIGMATWIEPDRERLFGQEIEIACSVNHALFDNPIEEVLLLSAHIDMIAELPSGKEHIDRHEIMTGNAKDED